MMGLPELRHAIAAHYAALAGRSTLDPEAEVMVTSGATEAIAGALLALIEPGDEVVLFEPMYDAYLPLVRRAGGVPRFVTLAPPAFRLDRRGARPRLLAARPRWCCSTTRSTRRRRSSRDADLALLADFCIRHDAIALCDEVWEHVVFDGRRHKPLIALPGMRERTVKIGSAGKIFNLTGWKVGFVCAARADHARAGEGAPVHHLHDAAEPAGGGRLRAWQGRRLFRGHARRLRRAAATASRRASPGSASTVIPSQATYFLNIDIAPLGEPDDTAFCRRLVLDHGVAAIPVSAFYAEGRGADRGALLLRQARRDAGCGAGAAGGGGAEGGLGHRAGIFHGELIEVLADDDADQGTT